MFSALALNNGNMRSRINAFAALAPVVSFKYQDSARKEAGIDVFVRTATRVTAANKIYELGPSLGDLKQMIPVFRLIPGINKKIEALRNQTISVKQLLHFCQLELSGLFQEYDYGEEENQERYNQDTPPEIPLGDLSTPVGMWIGENDKIGTSNDNDYVKTLLPNVEEYEVVEGFLHNSF